MTARRARFDVRTAAPRIALALGGLVLVNVALSALLVRPKVTEYRQLTSASSPHLDAVKKREKEVEAREAYAASLVKARDDMKRLAVDVLSTRQRRMVGVQLEQSKLAREFGIAWNQVHYENEITSNGALDRFGIVMPLNGGYKNLRKFIQAVESSENFLVIERVALGEGKSADVVELNITLATYFIAPDADVDAIGKKPIAPPRS